jgi:hypothetical protein
VKGLHLTKNKDGELKSRFIWDANPLNNIRSALEKDLGSEPSKNVIEMWKADVVLICSQNIDVMEYASQKYNIDWKKLQLEFYANQGWVEGETDDE